MKVPPCELCQKNKASHICSRCHRLVCDSCYNAELDACLDCIQIKKSLERDYLIQLDKYKRLLSDLENRISSSTCRDCPLIREVLLSLLSHLKRLKEILRIDGLYEAELRANWLYKEYEKLAIKYISTLILKLKRSE